MLLADSVRDLKCINKRIYSFKQVPLPSDLLVDCENIMSTRIKYKLLEVTSPARTRLGSGFSLSAENSGPLRPLQAKQRLVILCKIFVLSTAILI